MKTSHRFFRKSICFIALSALLIISFGCGASKNGATVVDGKLVANKDGYIYLTCDEFWQLMNGDLFKQNFMKMSNYEFGSEYNGKTFAITGTLKYSIAFDEMILYDGDNSVEGGSQFDYYHVLKSLGVNDDKDYDGKKVIIRLTLNEGDIVKDDIRAYPNVTDCTIELEK